MPRGPLSADQKLMMQSARKSTAQDREAAFAALESNAQFTNPKFWARLPTECQDAVLEAIRKAQRNERRAEVEFLKQRLTELEAEG